MKEEGAYGKEGEWECGMEKGEKEKGKGGERNTDM